jgi:hypothetical protein
MSFTQPVEAREASLLRQGDSIEAAIPSVERTSWSVQPNKTIRFGEF